MTEKNKIIIKFTNSSVKISQKSKKAIELLDSWIEKGNKREQKETWEYLKKGLDKNRLSDRKFF